MLTKKKKQGRIHGNPVADGWAGAVIQKPLVIQKYFGRTDGRTDTARRRVACPRLKTQLRYRTDTLFSEDALLNAQRPQSNPLLTNSLLRSSNLRRHSILVPPLWGRKKFMLNGVDDSSFFLITPWRGKKSLILQKRLGSKVFRPTSGALTAFSD